MTRILRISLLLAAAAALFPETPARFLDGFRVLGSLRQGNLEVVAVRGAGKTATPLLRPLLTLDEALPGGRLSIQETPGGGTVNTLLLRNHGDRPVFILAGEILAGAKQDRILQQDVVLPTGGKSVQVPAFCVEHGRWKEQSAAFYTEKASAPIAVRRAAQASKDQSVVWEEVAANNAELSAATSTGSLSATYKSGRLTESRKPYLDALARLPRSFPTASGAVVLVNGRVAGADLFQDPSTFARLWGKLLDSYVAEAVRREGRQDSGEALGAEAFLARARAARIELGPTAGLGQGISLEGEGLKGSGVALQGPVHLDLFPLARHGAATAPRVQRQRLHQLNVAPTSLRN